MNKWIVLFSILTLLAVPVFAAPVKGKTFHSEKIGYSFECPENWWAACVYSKSEVVEENIREHVLMWNESNAYVSIDVWKTSIDNLDIWLRVMDHKIGLSELQAQDQVVTEKALKSKSYKVLSNKQAYDSYMTFFKKGRYIFRISYWQRDGGEAIKVYHSLLKSFTFGKKGKVLMKFSEEFVRSTTSRVYSCGGQNDSCNCGMNNPYPCCDNDSNCTWWAWHKACCVWGIGLPSPWRHAKYWATDLSAHGYRVSSTPAVNTIACRNSGTYGHVAWVIAVNGDQVQVSEMNCCPGCPAGVRTKWYSKSYYTGGYIYKP